MALYGKGLTVPHEDWDEDNYTHEHNGRRGGHTADIVMDKTAGIAAAGQAVPGNAREDGRHDEEEKFGDGGGDPSIGVRKLEAIVKQTLYDFRLIPFARATDRDESTQQCQRDVVVSRTG